MHVNDSKGLVVITPVRTFKRFFSDFNLCVFKAPFTPGIHKLAVKKKFDDLRNALERALGREVLRSVNVVIAHPIERCLFRDTYYLNYTRSG